MASNATPVISRLMQGCLKPWDEDSDDPFASMDDDEDELDRNELVVDNVDRSHTANNLCWYLLC